MGPSEVGEVQSVRLDHHVDSEETARADTGAVHGCFDICWDRCTRCKGIVKDFSGNYFFYLECTFEIVRFMCLIVVKRSTKTREGGEIPPLGIGNRQENVECWVAK